MLIIFRHRLITNAHLHNFCRCISLKLWRVQFHESIWERSTFMYNLVWQTVAVNSFSGTFFTLRATEIEGTEKRVPPESGFNQPAKSGMGDWQPFIYGGLASCAAEFGKCRIGYNVNLLPRVTWSVQLLNGIQFVFSYRIKPMYIICSVRQIK